MAYRRISENQWYRRQRGGVSACENGFGAKYRAGKSIAVCGAAIAATA